MNSAGASAAASVTNPIHADALGLAIDIASGGLKDIERLVIQEQDDLLENPHACLMDGLHPFGVNRLCRIVEIG